MKSGSLIPDPRNYILRIAKNEPADHYSRGDGKRSRIYTESIDDHYDIPDEDALERPEKTECNAYDQVMDELKKADITTFNIFMLHFGQGLTLKETKQRIFENVLTADMYGSERPEEIVTTQTNSEEREIVMNTNNNRDTKKRSRHGAIIAAACAIIAIGCGVMVMNPLKNRMEPTETPAAESSVVTTQEESSREDSSEEEIKTEDSTPQKRDIQPWAKDLLERNEDTVGWIKIPGITDDNGEEYINFPVLQGEDNEYYLYKNIDEEYYESGSIYADAWSTIDEYGQSDNLTIFGHHMGVLGTSFTHLSEYKKGAEFLREHPTIEFNTIYENDARYAIVSCFMINTQPEEDNGNLFEYIGYRDFDDDEYKFDTWYNEISKRSWYTNDIKCTENDKYITLSTCSKLLNNDDLRWVIVAKKLTPEDDLDHIIASYQDKDDKDIYFPQFWIDRYGNKTVDEGWAL